MVLMISKYWKDEPTTTAAKKERQQRECALLSARSFRDSSEFCGVNERNRFYHFKAYFLKYSLKSLEIEPKLFYFNTVIFLATINQYLDCTEMYIYSKNIGTKGLKNWDRLYFWADSDTLLWRHGAKECKFSHVKLHHVFVLELIRKPKMHYSF